MQREAIVYRPPGVEEGAAIWQLVGDSGVLDRNSTYCYLLLCKHFSETCAVAEANGEILGFVTGYLPPGRKSTFFLWQIGVQADQRGRGLAIGMVQNLLHRDSFRGVRYLETTVAPSNEASRALFTAVARSLGTNLSEQPYFDEALFPGENHEAEKMLRIGPFAL